MPKEYFTHDYYARNDPKCKALIRDFGMVGYGVYWYLVEMMNEQGGRIKKFPSLYKSLAEEMKVKLPLFEKQINAFINDYHLFTEDANHIWSESVLNRLSIRNRIEAKIHEQKSDAGKLGGIKSGESRRKKQNEASKLKEKKGKEIKGKERKDIGIYPKHDHEIELSELNIGQATEYIFTTKKVSVNKQTILSLFAVFKTKNFTGKKFYNSNQDIISHFFNSLKYENIQNGTAHQPRIGQRSAKSSNASDFIEEARFEYDTVTGRTKNL